MLRRIVFLAALCTVAMCLAASAVVISRAEEMSPPSSVEQIHKLQDSVMLLEARVAALEKRQASVVLPPTSDFRNSPSEPIPKDWQRSEFNGVPYYIVPLGSSGGGRTTSGRP